MIVAVPIFLQQEKRVMKAEIQLRTIAMDSWASLEHQLRYKKGSLFDGEMSDELKKCADLSAELDERMDSLRGKVFHMQSEKEEAKNSAKRSSALRSMTFDENRQIEIEFKKVRKSRKSVCSYQNAPS